MRQKAVEPVKKGSESVETEYFRLSTDEVYESLKTCADGLSQEVAEERLVQFGKNEIREFKGKPLIVRFLANFTHLMAIMLWVGGIAALIARMPQLAIAVWMVNVINGAFSFWQEFRAEKATAALRKLIPTYARVLRLGVEQKILAEELAPGDIILLSEGDNISADCRLINQAELRCDQSTLTGESRPVSKSTAPVQKQGISYTEIPNLVFAGTHVASGTGKAIVFATAMNTQFGKIANLTQQVGEDLSPLQKEMVVATRVITIIALGVGLVFFILAVLFAGISLIESFIFFIGMVVAFVPEGMLPLVTLSLAMGTQRMAKRHALIKKLSAVETLGCTTVICTDKTGTLTQNEMTVRDIWLPSENGLGGRKISVSGIGYEPTGRLEENGKLLDIQVDEDLKQLLRVASLCNNARLLTPEQSGNGNGKAHRWSILGDPTEAALIVTAQKAGLNLGVEESRTPRIREIPFESRRKRMSTVHTIPQTTASVRRQEVAFVKGAPKEVLDLCTHIRKNGKDVALGDAERNAIMVANDDFARDGLRVLAMSERKLPEGMQEYKFDLVEKNLTFLGLMAMMDPPRPEVTEAVEKCHRAGIRVIMITGDYGLTAESIAKRIGIIKEPNPQIITGFELETIPEKDLEEVFKREVIFARVAPEQKLRVVTALQALGNVVAVTGDGVNDAPALKKADIGVAMGLAGTDVAKEASDMILTDDNFASIVNAVEEGRAVYANIRKFTTYIFTSNTPEAIPFILYVLSGTRIPLALNVMHILSIDLGTDMVPALGLGAELPEPGIMDRKPRDLKEHVINKSLLIRAYGYIGIPQGLITMIAFYFMYWTNGYAGKFIDLPGSGPLYKAATAMALASVVATQIGNLFAQRTEKGSTFKIPLFNNHLLWIGIGTELVLIALIVYAPFMNTFIGTGPFNPIYWLFLFAWTPSLVIIDEFVKWMKRRMDLKKGGLER
jgi:potassium/sodium efflux P-type ATPase